MSRYVHKEDCCQNCKFYSMPKSEEDDLAIKKHKNMCNHGPAWEFGFCDCKNLKGYVGKPHSVVHDASKCFRYERKDQLSWDDMEDDMDCTECIVKQMKEKQNEEMQHMRQTF